MNSRVVAIAIASIALAGSVDAAGDAQQPAIPHPDAKLIQGPAGTYARTCGYCHGANVGPVILGGHLPPAAIKQMVRNGMGAMPAFRPTEIDDRTLDTLAGWISTSQASHTEHGR